MKMNKENMEKIKRASELYEKFLVYWELLNTRLLDSPIESFDWWVITNTSSAHQLRVIGIIGWVVVSATLT